MRNGPPSSQETESTTRDTRPCARVVARSRSFAALLLLAFATALCAQDAVDRHGDPLPPYAVARLGTLASTIMGDWSLQEALAVSDTPQPHRIAALPIPATCGSRPTTRRACLSRIRLSAAEPHGSAYRRE